MIKVLLVDDQELVRAGLRAILRSPFGFEIVGDCADGTVVTGMVDALAPDAVLMDVRMPLVDGIVAPGASERMRMPRRCWRSPSSTTRKCWPACSGPSLRLRAQGRTRRGPASAPFALSPGVTPGSTRLSQAAAWQLTDRRPHPRPDRTPPVSSLTLREREVLTLIGVGKTNAELRDRAAVMVFAFDHNLIVRLH